MTESVPAPSPYSKCDVLSSIEFISENASLKRRRLDTGSGRNALLKYLQPIPIDFNASNYIDLLTDDLPVKNVENTKIMENM